MNSFQKNVTAPKLRHAVQHAHDKVLILPASIADHQCSALLQVAQRHHCHHCLTKLLWEVRRISHGGCENCHF